ncbi:MAG: hypothetical protein HZA67_02305 [Rhodospirillales bacterium]|nr:hypothetical protein [Rhodospirillales bacterium]
MNKGAIVSLSDFRRNALLTACHRKNTERAFRLAYPLALEGNAIAIGIVGACHLVGVEGKPSNAIEAWAWINVAVSSGNEVAAECLPYLEALLAEGDKPKAELRAFDIQHEILGRKSDDASKYKLMSLWWR